MSVVLMSKRELNRLDVLARLDSDRLTVASCGWPDERNSAAGVPLVE